MQSGARNATESFNRFVENAGDADSSGRAVGGAGRAAPEPDKRDFWDSFGQPSGLNTSESKGSLGTGAMKGTAGGTPVTSKGKTKPGDENWGEDW